MPLGVLAIITLIAYVSSLRYYRGLSQSNSINAVHFSPDKSLLLVCTEGDILRIYSMSTLTVARNYSISNDCVDARFSPNQQLIAYAVSGGSTSVYILNANYTTNKTLSSNFDSFAQIDFNNDSTKLLVCGKQDQDRGYEIFDVTSGTLLHYISNYTSTPLSCRFSKLNTYVVGSKSGDITYYLANYTMNAKYSTGGGPDINGVAFSADSTVIATAWGDAQRKVATMTAGTTTLSVSLGSNSDDHLCVEYSPDGFLLAEGDDENLVIYDATKAALPTVYQNNSVERINALHFSGDSCWLAAGSDSSIVHIFFVNCRNNQPAAISQIRCPIDYFLNSTNQCQRCVVILPGCRRCTSAPICLVCTDQYYLNGNTCTLCTSITPSCAECSGASNCTRCIGTYFLNGTTCSLCYAAITGCLNCANSTYCTTCVNNSFYRNTSTNSCSLCTVNLPNCLKCTTSATCIQCISSYFIDGTGGCSKCSMKCSTCQNTTNTCLSCDNGYYLSTTSCNPCPWNCINCTASNACNLCVSGFYLAGSTCTPCDLKCQTCITAATNCLSCNVGYYLNVNTCTLCNTNCASCITTANYCLSCNVGSYLDSTAHTCPICNSLTAKCLLCNSTTCYQCASGFFLNGPACSSCTSIVGCQLCLNSTDCSVCLQRFYLTGNTCTPCIWPCLNCANSTVCLGCAIGYYYNSANTSCLKCNCPTCNSSSYCLSCQVGQYFSSGSCLYCNSIHTMCRSCSNSTNCLQCSPPYVLSGITCALCSSGCSSCTSSGCTTCTLGYYISGSSCSPCALTCATCVSSGNCTQCINGYYFISFTCVSCSNLSTGCDACNSTTCLSCNQISGFFLNSSLCSNCSLAMANCKTCNASNVCTQCKISYALNNSNSACIACSTLIPFCQICSSKTNCTKCAAGYFSSATSCSACSNGCFQCSSSSQCLKCFPQFLLTGTNACTQCASALLGCQRCISLAVCQECGFGFYKSGNTCTPCLATLAGCLACTNNSACISCQSGFYLNSSTNLCIACGQNMTGCGFCRSSSSCDICLSGYFLNASLCQLCSTPFCLTCNTSQCIQCESGYYLNGSSCSSCVSLFPGCIMCNSTKCQSCQTGYYNNGASCSHCSTIGCQVCNSTNSTQCLSCSSTYYLNSGACILCSSVKSNCITCTSNGLSCTRCDQGYFIDGNDCTLCSIAITNCRSCSSNTLCSACDSGSILLNNFCSLCKSLIDGCLFCSSATSCSNCQQGYYLNSSGLCQRCSVMSGCLICRNMNSCKFCNTGYYLQSGTCQYCNKTMQGCIACSSSNTCIACQGNYSLGIIGCSIIKSTVTYYPYEELSLKTVYINASMLKHTLWVSGTNFAYTKTNLMQTSNISYVTAGGKQEILTITGFQWGFFNVSIIFYTNNPFKLSQIYSSMKLFKVRLLWAGQIASQKLNNLTKKESRQKGERLLESQSLTNLELNAQFQLAMDEATVLEILPTSLHGGNLFLSYSSTQPQFVASTLLIYDYKFNYFGIIMTFYLLIFYLVKGVVVDSKGKDKGELIAHILLLKTPAFMLYPTFGELMNYCSGFMQADLPWLNNIFSYLLTEPRDITPAPYLLFYNNLNIASTFLLPIILILICYVILGLVSYLKKNSKQTVVNIALVIYDYFLGGLSFAAVGCVQGAFLNPMANEFTIYQGFYLFGIVIFVLVLGEAIWSTAKNSQNMFKIRIIIKSSLLSIMHYNALYLFSIVLCFQTFFIILKMRLSQIKHPKLWLISNILPNISLLMLVQLSRSLASIYVSSILVIISSLLQILIMAKEYKVNKMIREVKINQLTSRQIDNSFMKTLGVYLEGDQKGLEVTKYRQTQKDNKFRLTSDWAENENNVKENFNSISGQNFFTIDKVLKQN